MRLRRLLWLCAVLAAWLAAVDCGSKRGWKPKPLKPGAWHVDARTR